MPRRIVSPVQRTKAGLPLTEIELSEQTSLAYPKLTLSAIAASHRGKVRVAARVLPEWIAGFWDWSNFRTTPKQITFARRHLSNGQQAMAVAKVGLRSKQPCAKPGGRD
jgi:hypothetical protein